MHQYENLNDRVVSRGDNTVVGFHLLSRIYIYEDMR